MKKLLIIAMGLTALVGMQVSMLMERLALSGSFEGQLHPIPVSLSGLPLSF